MQLVMFATQSTANRSKPNLTGADMIVFVCFVLLQNPSLSVTWSSGTSILCCKVRSCTMP